MSTSSYLLNVRSLDVACCLANRRSRSTTLRTASLASRAWTATSTGIASGAGADDQDRTGDLVLTKDALCQLSYIGLRRSHLRRLAASADKSAVLIA
jgi:hypothetical protein